MSTDISGVGQPGFVARIGELGLRTVRLAVVDQHGAPRGKMLSPEAAIAAMSDGLDFSGAIYSLDTGNQVFGAADGQRVRAGLPGSGPRCGWTAWATRWRRCATRWTQSACCRGPWRTSGGRANWSSASHPQYVAGLLEHAVPMTVFGVPTVNGYKRFRPYSFAPDRVCWAVENRGALVRVQGSRATPARTWRCGSASPPRTPTFTWRRTSRRAWTGCSGACSRHRPFRPTRTPSRPPALPMSLAAAVDALDADGFYRKAFGDALVAYLVMMKRSEIGRYEDALAQAPLMDGQDVSDWEMREYFEFF